MEPRPEFVGPLFPGELTEQQTNLIDTIDTIDFTGYSTKGSWQHIEADGGPGFLGSLSLTATPQESCEQQQEGDN